MTEYRLQITGDLDVDVKADIESRFGRVEIVAVNMPALAVDLFLEADAMRALGETLISSANKIDSWNTFDRMWGSFK